MGTATVASRPDCEPGSLTADSFRDPAVEAAIAASGDAPRWLAEADRRTGGGASDREVAFRIYCALPDAISPDDADGRRRLSWIVDNAVFVHPSLARLCRDALPLTEGDRRARCAMIAVRAMEIAGAAAGAWEFAVREYAAARGSGTKSEAILALGAARVASGQRAHARVLAFCRRGIEVSRALGDAALEVQFHLARSASYEAMKDWPRTGAALDDVAALLPSVADPHGRVFAFMSGSRRASVCIETGAYLRALGTLDALDGSIPGASNPLTVQGIALLRARALTGLGRIAEAKAALREGEAVPTSHLMQEFSLGRVRVDVALAVGDDEAACRELRRQANLLDGDARTRLDAHGRLHFAMDIADLVTGNGLDPELALRAADLAAEALLETLREIGDEVRELPEIGDLHPEDLDALSDHRHRIESESLELLRSIQSLLHARLGRGDAGLFDRLTASSSSVTVCAWCCRMRGTGASEESVWLPVAQTLADDSLPSITHGICPTCAARIAVR
ncbi:MAG: hypothetical protein HMLKMBBP_03371 [Planctomycetes bacterium]|nr:hypothetical protein [Planctomycetota bacterium]